MLSILSTMIVTAIAHHITVWGLTFHPNTLALVWVWVLSKYKYLLFTVVSISSIDYSEV